MTAPRDIRDLLGEALRRGMYGLMRLLWADAPADAREIWMKRADRVIVVLGVTLWMAHREGRRA